MQAVIEAKLFDKPGELLELLEPIARFNGNILSVSHIRELKSAGKIPARIELEVPDRKAFDDIINTLEKKIEISNAKLNDIVEIKRRSFAVLLLGHVMDSDANDTIKRIVKCGASVSSFYLGIKNLELPSTAMLWVHIDDKKYDALMEELDTIAKEKKLMVIVE